MLLKHELSVKTPTMAKFNKLLQSSKISQVHFMSLHCLSVQRVWRVLILLLTLGVGALFSHQGEK